MLRDVLVSGVRLHVTDKAAMFDDLANVRHPSKTIFLTAGLKAANINNEFNIRHPKTWAPHLISVLSFEKVVKTNLVKKQIF